MFFTYLRRELRRRRKAALVVASGLALGIALVIVVSSVSSGMEKAQGKVLQSLYGLGTDMTVTKAAALTNSTSDRPRFNFDAKDSDSDKEQSSDRVMVQGFQTLASSTVSKVDAQKGVADSVGGLSLQVIRINGQFTRGQFKQDPNSGGSLQGGPGGGQQSPEGRVEGGGANFDVNNYTVYGTDVTKPSPGPADLVEDHQRSYVQDLRDERQGRRRGHVVRQGEEAQARWHRHRQERQVQDHRHRDPGQR